MGELNELRQRGLLDPGIKRLLAQQGFASPVISSATSGSLPVFWVNEHMVLKLFPAIFRRNYENECRFLQRLAGRTAFEIPQLVRCGEADGWGFVLMTRVTCTQVSTIWNDVDEATKEHICTAAGEVARSLHDTLQSTDAERAAWRAYVVQQSEQAMEQRRRHGLAEDLIRQIPAYLEPVLELILNAPVTFLHTELMREHLFVDATRRRVQSMIDGEEAMMGAAEYDFGAFALFYGQGHASRIEAFLRGYRYRPTPSPFPLARRVFCQTLLHRFSNLPWYMQLTGVDPAQISDLSQLESACWPVPG